MRISPSRRRMSSLRQGMRSFHLRMSANSARMTKRLFGRAQKLGAVILTSDRDFYHTVPLIHPEHCGIIVVALRQPNRKAILTRLQWFFENFDCPMVNRVFILWDYSCRAK